MAYECVAARAADDKCCERSGCGRQARTRRYGRFCTAHHNAAYRSRVNAGLEAQHPACSVAGCDRPARNRSVLVCEAHYYLKARTGRAEKISRKGRGDSPNPYTMIHRPGHPLADKRGNVREHRVVLFEAIGYGPHACRWCGAEVDWMVSARGPDKTVGALEVDHLDGDKAHNAIENLVPSCHRCNGARGLFMGWLRRHGDDPMIIAALQNRS